MQPLLKMKKNNNKKEQPELPVPINYFGKGRNHTLSPSEIDWYNQEFDRWVTEHPDDPTGEEALAEQEGGRMFIEQQKPRLDDDEMPIAKSATLFHLDPKSPKSQVRLTIQTDVLQAFKRRSYILGRSMSHQVTQFMLSKINP